MVYKMATTPKVIKAPVITVFRKTICLSWAVNVSSQFGGKVGGFYVNYFSLSQSIGGSVNAFTPEGDSGPEFMNL